MTSCVRSRVFTYPNGGKMHKNIAFTSIIRIEGRQYEFNFRKQPSPDFTYHADVTNAKGERVMFRMVQHNGKWNTAGALVPAWIEQHVELIGSGKKHKLKIVKIYWV